MASNNTLPLAVHPYLGYPQPSAHVQQVAPKPPALALRYDTAPSNTGKMTFSNKISPFMASNNTPPLAVHPYLGYPQPSAHVQQVAPKPPALALRYDTAPSNTGKIVGGLVTVGLLGIGLFATGRAGMFGDDIAKTFGKHIKHIETPVDSFTKSSPKTVPNVEPPAVKSKPRKPDTVDKLKLNETQTFLESHLKYDISLGMPEGSRHESLSPKEAIKLLANAKTVTHGDLHGNFLKAVELLGAQGLVSIKDTSKYVELEELISKYLLYQDNVPPQQKAEHLQKLMELYKGSIEITAEQLKGKRAIFVGDDVADRGPTDALTLMLFNDIREINKDAISVVYSNHADFLIEGYKYYKTKGIEVIETQFRKQMGSAYYTLKLMEDVKTTHPSLVKELEKLYENHMKTYELFNYDSTLNTLTMHAPMDAALEKKLRQASQNALHHLPMDKPVSSWTKAQYEEFVGYLNTMLKEAINVHLSSNASPQQEKMSEDVIKLFYDVVWNRHSAGKFTNTGDIGMWHPSLSHLSHGHTRGNEVSEPLGTNFHIHGLDNDSRKKNLPGAISTPHGRAFISETA
jgi:hypothetical protein